MKDLKQAVLDKIKELGETEAAKYFGRSRQTIYSWAKPNGTIPLAAVQQVLADMPPETGVAEPPKETPEQAAVPGKPEPIQVPAPRTPVDVSPTRAWMEETDKRLNRLEDFARSMTDPDLKAMTSQTRPAAMQQVTQGPHVVPASGPAPTFAPTAVPPEEPVNDPSPLMKDILRPHQPRRN